MLEGMLHPSRISFKSVFINFTALICLCTYENVWQGIRPDFKLLTCQGKPYTNKRGAEQECAKQACVELKIIA